MDNSKVKIEDAKKALLNEAKERTDRCKKEVQSVLDRNNCTLDVSVLLTSKSIVPRVEIISK